MARTSVVARATGRDEPAEPPGRPSSAKDGQDKKKDKKQSKTLEAIDGGRETPQRHVSPTGALLWGFVRRSDDVQDRVSEVGLLPHDIAIWYDDKRCRFQIASHNKEIDDLAPVEFVQFVRALRFSPSQVLFKIENHHDGSSGRPVCVWPRV